MVTTFLPVLSRWVGTLRGARPLASLDTPLHVSRKDYCFTQMFLRVLLLRSCSFQLFLFLFLSLISRFFFSTGHVTNSFCKRARLFWSRIRWSFKFFLPTRGDVLLTGIKYFQQERSLDELPPRVMSLPWCWFRLKVQLVAGKHVCYREYTLQL